MGLHFIFNGARQGEPGVIASLQENRSQLQRVTAGFGWSLDEPHVEMMYRSPVDIYIDEWVYELIQAVERTGARRVLLDSLADLRLTVTDETRFQEFSYSLVQRFSQQGVSVMMTIESPDLFRAERLSESAISHLSDNVVLLSYIREENAINRAITVVKSRASITSPLSVNSRSARTASSSRTVPAPPASQPIRPVPNAVQRRAGPAGRKHSPQHSRTAAAGRPADWHPILASTSPESPSGG
jgi:circadian clock protein KaiC